MVNINTCLRTLPSQREQDIGNDQHKHKQYLVQPGKQ
jgi:hypothetical protein